MDSPSVISPQSVAFAIGNLLHCCQIGVISILQSVAFAIFSGLSCHPKERTDAKRANRKPRQDMSYILVTSQVFFSHGL